LHRQTDAGFPLRRGARDRDGGLAPEVDRPSRWLRRDAAREGREEAGARYVSSFEAAMSLQEPSGIVFFASPAKLRSWFRQNHRTAQELWAGFYKKGSGKASITWPESVDEALCVGWIDGIRKSLDAERYVNRFTPRKTGSTWSAVNIARVRALEAGGRMRP